MSYPHPPIAPPKSVGVAYVLLIVFMGVFGIHHFYLGKIGRGLAYLLTLGFLLVGPIIDLFTLPSQVRMINAQRAALGTGGVHVNVTNSQNVAQNQVQQHRETDDHGGTVV